MGLRRDVLTVIMCACAVSCSRDAPPARTSAAVTTTAKSASSSLPPTKLSVSRFKAAKPIITDADARTILAAASAVLQTDNGPAANGDGDVGCPVKLDLDGPVTEFASIGIINNKADYAAVCKEPGRIHVVNQINYCDGFHASNILGCSDLPGTCMTIVRQDGDEGILWAHEYGHNKNRDHPCEVPNCTSAEKDRVMHPVLEGTHLKIGSAECTSYEK